jgi:GntP family gluconate:H+ symporter
MDINTSLKTWTLSTIIIPIFGSILIVILSLIFH